jgi:hypothetical protein
MSFFDLVVGKPLATTEERAEHIGPIAGIPVFGLEALSSAAYGPEAALTLLIPLGLSYLFLGTLLLVIVVGTIRTVAAAGHPVPMVRPPLLPATTSLVTFWLLLKVFASGCTAMTGVEAVSNGVMAFREPTQKNAKRTLTIIILLLMVFLAGIALLCRAYGIGATDPGSSSYQSVLSQLLSAVMGRGWFYYLTIASILAVLALSANTSYADFPRLTRAIAQRDYLPHVFKIRGRRLLYSHGIYALVGFTAFLLIVFGGVTDRLIPLFAIGAFLAFTLSQAGMVMHWKRQGGKSTRHRMFINGVGAFATGVTLFVVLIAKFTEGAWITAVLIPVLMIAMSAVKSHYDRVNREVAVNRPICLDRLDAPLIVVPLERWTRITEKGLRFALKLSDHVQAVHVDAEECYEEVRQMWQRNVATPIRESGRTVPELVLVSSPYRFVIVPLVDYILKVERDHPERQIAVLVPELVVKHWWQTPLHNQRAQLLKLLLLVRGNPRITVIIIPWYL